MAGLRSGQSSTVGCFMSKTGPRSGRGHPQSPWFRLGVVAVGGGAEGLPLPLFSLHPLHFCQGTRGGRSLGTA